jgi:hypothetical protein
MQRREKGQDDQVRMSAKPKESGWLKTAFARYGKMLGISDRVTLALVRNPADDTSTAGCCVQRPEHNEHRVELPDNIEDTTDSRQTIIHELIHVGHARIDHFVEDAILPQLEKQARKIAAEGLKQHYESYVNSLALALCQWDEKHRKRR